MSNFKKITTLLTIAIWLVYCMPSVLWLIETLHRQYTLVNTLLLLAILCGLGYKVQRDFSRLREYTSTWALQGFPLFLWIASAISYLLIPLILDFNILKCIFFLSGSYALVSIFIPYPTWRKGFIPVILIILTLPFGSQLDIYLGFPLRLVSAQWVMQGLQSIGIQGISDATIITIENQSAEVSASCSGLNGLWTGWLFFFFISWLENYAKNIKWLMSFALLNLMLLSFNTARIFILVLLETASHQHAVANALHIPLGLIGFIASCILTLLFLRSSFFSNTPVFSYTLPSPPVHRISVPLAYTAIVPLIFISTLLPLGYVAQAHQAGRPVTEAPLQLSINPAIIAGPCEMTAVEKNVFKKEKSSCYKFRFKSGGLSGSCLFVRSSDWHGHHPPDLCLQGNGFKIEQAETRLIEKDFPVHLLDLQHTDQTTCYWFQSPDLITQDHAERVWAEVRGQQKEWIMVSILFDQNPQQHYTDFQFILHQIRKAVHLNQQQS